MQNVNYHLVLIIDGNWLLRSRVYIFEKKFKKSQPEAVKRAAAEELKDTMARSILKILYKFPISNMILIQDCGSWRKTIQKPSSQQDIEYKGNRHLQDDIDWDFIFGVFDEFVEGFHNNGITICKQYLMEGDDWCWKWSRYLNSHNENALIWSSDRDLQQLVQQDGNYLTAWYNDKKGMVMAKTDPDDLVEMFMRPIINCPVKPILEKTKPIEYINPDSIVIEKVLCGDAGDNIRPVVSYQKNGRIYKFAPTDLKKMLGNIHIETISDLEAHHNDIAQYIIESKKFKPYNFSNKDICENLEYNTKEVWLNEKCIPGDIANKVSCDIIYKQANIEEIKQNYKLMSDKPDSNIEDIFAGAIY